VIKNQPEKIEQNFKIQQSQLIIIRGLK